MIFFAFLFPFPFWICFVANSEILHSRGQKLTTVCPPLIFFFDPLAYVNKLLIRMNLLPFNYLMRSTSIWICPTVINYGFLFYFHFNHDYLEMIESIVVLNKKNWQVDMSGVNLEHNQCTVMFQQIAGLAVQVEC